MSPVFLFSPLQKGYAQKKKSHSPVSTSVHHVSAESITLGGVVFLRHLRGFPIFPLKRLVSKVSFCLLFGVVFKGEISGTLKKTVPIAGKEECRSSSQSIPDLYPAVSCNMRCVISAVSAGVFSVGESVILCVFCFEVFGCVFLRCFGLARFGLARLVTCLLVPAWLGFATCRHVA